MNASETETKVSEDFIICVSKAVASEIRDDLREIFEASKIDDACRQTEDDDEEANAAQLTLEEARANYWRWRDIATDAMRQYRYAAAALARELRSPQEQNRRAAAAESSERPRHRGDTGTGEPGPAGEV